MASADLLRNADESELAYIYRLGKLRDNGIIDMTWTELAEVLNRNLREPDEYLSESAYRKKYNVLRQGYEEIFSKNDNVTSDDLFELKNEKNELIKERIKISDERRELKNLLRNKAREENFIEHIERIFKEHRYNPIEIHGTLYKPDIESDVDMIIPITDLHAGIKILNNWNKYDYDVMRKRFSLYSNVIKKIRDRHNAQNAYIVGSEFVSGIIHQTLRIESNDNVINQFLEAMNQIMWFLIQMSANFNEVHFYVAPGNHSRIFPKKEDNLKGENLDHLAIHYLKGYLQNIDNIYFHENEIDESIVSFDVRGNFVFSVHGDKDTPENVCRHITELTGVIPKICILGHRHTNAMISVNGGCKVIQSGSFSGIDSFCIDNRLRGRPEQAVCIVNDMGLECIYDVGLN